jgi:hypothetical protein
MSRWIVPAGCAGSPGVSRLKLTRAQVLNELEKYAAKQERRIR